MGVLPVLGSAISAFGDRLDAKFLMAYWLPAFVFALGGVSILGLQVGLEELDAWVADLDSVEQTLGVVIIVLLISMLAFVMRALNSHITELFVGAGLPRPVAEWSTQGQRRAKARTAHLRRNEDDREAATTAAIWLQRRFPVNDADMKPTLFGNILASVGEHPRIAYCMEGVLWWPRLVPLLPESFQDTLAGAQAPMMALLNLSIVFFALGPLAVVILGLGGSRWVEAIAVLVGALILSRLCYRAAVSQAAEVGSMLRVAFDLYRRDILDQLDVPHPADLAAERALWLRLTAETLALPEQASTAAPASEMLPGAAASEAMPRKSRQRNPTTAMTR